MKKFISLLLGQPKAQPRPPSSQPASIDNPSTIVDGSENATRRQLVQVLLRDLLRRSGIPPHWLECHMLLVSSRSKGAGMYLRLVIKHWDARLMNYTFAFQNELMNDILRFDPQAATWLHGLSWELDVAQSCTFTKLPDKHFWSEAATQIATTTAPVAAPMPSFKTVQTVDELLPDANEPLDDLEKLFAIRDRELSRQAAQGVTPVGYEKTQPSPL